MSSSYALSLGKPILCVGNLSLDLLTVCQELPVEGKMQRSEQVYYQQGGHASIVSLVLSQLGNQSEFLGMLSRSLLLQETVREMQGRGIQMSLCPKTDEEPGFSTIFVAKKTGQRSVVHCDRNFPYVSYENFEKFELSKYGWVHFEAKCVRETLRMMRRILDFNNDRVDRDRVRISLRVSSNYAETKDLFDMCDYVLFSRQLAMQLGWQSASETCHQLDANLRVPRAIKTRRPCIICSWGPKGAGCLTGEGVYHELPPLKLKRVMDTHGAGACFTAGFIYATYIRGMGLSYAVEFANKVAGHKTTSFGYKHISNLEIYPVDDYHQDDHHSSEEYEDSEAEEVIQKRILNRKIKYSDGKLATKLLNEFVPGPTPDVNITMKDIREENPARVTIRTTIHQLRLK